ncbi:reverse transcriptase domain-containing protein [Tanacetum coccineum]
MQGARGKKVICYNCRGEGHVARQCKEPKRKMDSQYFKDKALLMEAKEKGDVLDAEAKAFSLDVDCTAPYDLPQALTTTNMFQANQEDAYDHTGRRPNAAVAFMANLSSHYVYQQPSQIRRVPYDQRNNPPQHPRFVYPSILDINYFRHFLDILRNYDPMDDEPMWAVDRVVAPTPGSAITITETANEFAIKGSSNTDTDIIMARMDAITIKIDAQYKELQSRAKKPTPDLVDDDIPMSREEEAKFMQTFRKTRFYNDYRDRDSNRDNWRSSGRNDYNRDNYRSNTYDKSYDLQKQFNDFMKSQQSTNAFVKETFMDLKTQLKIVVKNHQASIQNLETKFDRLADKQSGRPSRSLPSNTQPNPRGNNSKAYQPPQSRNEHVNVVFTRSGKSYDPPDNPNDQQNNSENPINFDSDDEDDEPTPQPKNQLLKPVKEQRYQNHTNQRFHILNALEKKMEAQYGKFLDMI